MRETPNQQPKGADAPTPEQKPQLNAGMLQFLDVIVGTGPRYIQGILFNLVLHGRPDMLDQYEREALLEVHGYLGVMDAMQEHEDENTELLRQLMNESLPS